MPEIGDQLRETRMRNRIDITEVEAATKIRAKYLRALENEEWELLPGPTFVKTFLRTYADYLGLDARNLVEEYRSRYERPAPQELAPFGASLGGRRSRPRRLVFAPWMAMLVGVLLLIGALYLLGTWCGEPLIRNVTFQAGQDSETFKSKRFLVSFGTGAAVMRVDGKPYEVSDDAPIGYEVRAGGKPRAAPEDRRPTCEG